MGGFSDFALVPEQGATPAMEQLPPDMQQSIRTLAAKIDVRDGAQVMGFGARAQKEMGTFSDLALAQLLGRDEEPLGAVMQELADRIRACSFAGEAKGMLGRLLGRPAPLSQVRAAYEKAEPRIGALCDEMTDRRVALMRDGAVLERIYARNEDVYRELCSLIVVGEEALRQAKARGEDAAHVDRLARRIEDIRLTQLSSTQLAAQIRMIQKSGETACEKLRAALETTIPLWKSQMAAALGLARATDALRMADRTGKEAARGIRRGARELSAQTQAYSREASRRQAEQTAEALLGELEEIERELRAHAQAARAAQG